MTEAELVSALQTVVSPVVLISGVGMLVLSMTNRFSHLTDRVRVLADERRTSEGVDRERAESQVRILYKRLQQLSLAIAFGLGSVLLTALLILTLFANVLFDTTFRGLIAVFFALGLISLVISLVLFIRDTSQSLTAMGEDFRDVIERKPGA